MKDVLWEGYAMIVSNDNWRSNVWSGAETMHFLHKTLMPVLHHENTNVAESAVLEVCEGRMSQSALRALAQSMRIEMPDSGKLDADQKHMQRAIGEAKYIEQNILPDIFLYDFIKTQ